MTNLSELTPETGDIVKFKMSGDIDGNGVKRLYRVLGIKEHVQGVKLALVTPVNDTSLNILLHPKLDELELVEPGTFRKLLLIQQSSVFGRVIWGEHASVYFYPLGYYGTSVHNNDIEKAINLAFNDWQEIHNK